MLEDLILLEPEAFRITVYPDGAIRIYYSGHWIEDCPGLFTGVKSDESNG